MTSVQLVADIISGTATASQEQSAGIEQINQAVGQMDEMTQQNAALVEEAAAAAEGLQDQSMKLAELVKTFKLVRTGQGAGGGRRQAMATPQGQSRSPEAAESLAA